MSDKVDMIFELLQDMRQDQIGIRDRQIKILSEGCPPCRDMKVVVNDNSNRIKKIEGILGKAIAAGLALASGTYGGGKLIEFFLDGK